jgi:deoxyribose-phosphate aldolase
VVGRSAGAVRGVSVRTTGQADRRTKEVLLHTAKRYTPEDLTRVIVSSLIEADVTEADIAAFVEEVKPYKFPSLAVDLPYIDLLNELLEGTGIRTTTVASYPLGGMTTEVKIQQVEFARDHGAYDIDVSMNYLAIKSGDFAAAEEDVRRVVAVAEGLKIVMIPQVAILTNEEKAKTCEALLRGGCTTIKTASGFGWKTEVEDVVFIKRLFGDDLHIEVSGGVRTYDDAIQMLGAGAEKLHTSTAFQVMGLDKQFSYRKKGTA